MQQDILITASLDMNAFEQAISQITDTLNSAMSSAMVSVSSDSERMTFSIGKAFSGLGTSLKESEAPFNKFESMIASTGNSFVDASDGTKELGGQMQELNSALNPLSATFAGLLLTFGMISKANETLKNEMSGAWDSIKRSIENVALSIKPDSFNQEINITAKLDVGELEQSIVSLSDTIKQSMSESQEVVAKDSENMKGSLTTMATNILDVPGKILSFMDQMGEVGGTISNYGDNFIALGDKMGKLGGPFSFLGTMAKGAGEAFTGLSGGASGLGGAFSSLATLINPVTLIVGTLAVAFVHLWESNEEFRENIIQSWNNIKEGIQKIVTAISESPAFKAFVDYIMKVWEPIESFAKVLFENIFKVVEECVNLVLSLVEGDWQGVWDSFCNILGGIGEIIEAGLNGAIDLILGIFGLSRDSIFEIWNGIVTFFSDIWGNIVTMAGEIWGGIVSFFGGLWDGISTAISEAWAAITSFFSEMWGGIVASAGEIWGGILDFFGGLWDGISTAATEAWATITSFFSEMWGGIIASAEEIWGGILDFFGGLWDGISTAATEAWTTITNFFSGMWGGISKSAEEIWGAIASFFTGLWEGIKTKASEIWGSISGFFTGIFDGISRSATEIWGKISSFLSGLWGGISTKATEIWNGIKESIEGIVTNLVNGVIGFFQTLPGEIIKIGGQIISGLWEGISASIGWLMDQINGFLNTVKEIFSFSFEINSPSKWARRIGAFVTEGLANGLEEEKSSVLGAANGIADEAQSALLRLKDMDYSVGDIEQPSLSGGINLEAEAYTQEESRRMREEHYIKLLEMQDDYQEEVSAKDEKHINKLLVNLNEYLMAGLELKAQASAEEYNLIEETNERILFMLTAYSSRWLDVGVLLMNKLLEGLRSRMSDVETLISQLRRKLDTLSSLQMSASVPMYGEGGIVTSPHLAIVGDVPEAIIPLNQLKNISELVSSTPSYSIPTVNQISDNRKEVTVNQYNTINQPCKSPAELAREIRHVAKELAFQV